jgi:hypothetical protein
MPDTDASKSLSYAQQHLERVLNALSDDPIDWSDLTIYGFYCLEAAIVAAASHIGLDFRRSHTEKADIARQLVQSHGLPDVADFLWDLNTARKASAYGDVDSPDLDAEDVARKLEAYVKAVSVLLGDGSNEQESDEQKPPEN